MTCQGTASYTIVSFHAHPDDEALLTAGSLAKAAAAQGYDVISPAFRSVTPAIGAAKRRFAKRMWPICMATSFVIATR